MPKIRRGPLIVGAGLLFTIVYLSGAFSGTDPHIDQGNRDQGRSAETVTVTTTVHASPTAAQDDKVQLAKCRDDLSRAREGQGVNADEECPPCDSAAEHCLSSAQATLPMFRPTKLPSWEESIFDMVVVTYADAETFSHSQNLLGSMQVWNSDVPVVVFDLGLTNAQLDIIASTGNVAEIRRLDLHDLPSFISSSQVPDLKNTNELWRAWLIQDTMDKAGGAGALFFAPTVEVRCCLDEVIKWTKTQNHFLVADLDKKMSVDVRAHKEVLCSYVFVEDGEDCERNELFQLALKKGGTLELPMLTSDVLYFIRSKGPYTVLLGSCVTCAMEADCHFTFQEVLTMRSYFQGYETFTDIGFVGDDRLRRIVSKDPLLNNDVTLYHRRETDCGGLPYQGYLFPRKGYIHPVPKIATYLGKDVSRAEAPGTVEDMARDRSTGCPSLLGSVQLANLYRQKNKRVFLIGNGPSIAQMPLHLLKHEYTMVFNRFDLFLDRLSWNPTFYLCIDSLVCPDIAPEVIAAKDSYRHIFIPAVYEDPTVKVDYRGAFKEIEDEIHWVSFAAEKGTRKKVTDDPEHQFALKTVGTVAAAGLELLHYLGFTEIYIIGVDMTYVDQQKAEFVAGEARKEDLVAIDDNDPNHFDPRYFGKGKKFHDPLGAKWMLQNFLQGVNLVRRRGAKIMNAGYGGRVPDDKVARVQFGSLFENIVDEEQLFIESLREAGVAVFADGPDFTSKIPMAYDLRMAEAFSKDLPLFYASSEMSQEHMQRWLFSHIPRGPFRDRYVWLKRDVYGPLIAERRKHW
eukprot:Clim_evm91s25 gene=Clim_evmTU91s25